MAQEFNALEEARKHPGAVAGVVFVLAGIGLATLLLNQRTGPKRYEVIRDRFDPRGWVDTEALRGRFEGVARGVRGRVDDLSHRAAELGDYAHDRFSHFSDDARERGREWQRQASKGRRRGKGSLHHYKKQARRYTEDASDFARDHAREGGALLAVATIAAAIGAAALEQKRKGDRLRE